MTLKEFFQRLPKDGWWLGGEGEIRRGNDGEMDDSRCQCPISSLKDLPTVDYLRVRREFGIDVDLSAAILAAADNDADPWTPTSGRIRRALLKHCGLTEPQP
jgi:hypothetical protein